MQRLSALDNSFLEIETDSIQANIGGVSIFEGPVPSQATLLRLVATKLDHVPRYRQRVQRLPLGLGMPVWVDDPYFNVAYHVRRTALPAPGGDAELDALVGRVMSQHLDRTRPLWETWVIEGLHHGRWGLLWKVHHAMVDGVSANDLLNEMLDGEPHPGSCRGAAGWRPEPVSAARLARASASGMLAPLRQVDATVRQLRATPADLALRALATARAILPIAPTLSPGRHHSSLNGPIGPHRRWARTAVSLEEVKRARERLGGTVNDVVLALVTTGVRDLLLARGEALDERTVRTMVPVSVRSAAEHGTLANRVSAVFVELPVGVDDPVERFHDLHRQMELLKETHSAVAGDALVGLAGFAPPMLLALGARLALRAPQRFVNTVATNVPGPQFPLYCAGRRMVESWPYVMLAARVRIVTAIFSYDGTLYFGVTGDYDSAADVGVLARGIRAGVDELLATPAGRRGRRGSQPPPPRADGARPGPPSRARPTARRGRPHPAPPPEAPEPPAPRHAPRRRAPPRPGAGRASPPSTRQPA